MLIDWRVVKSCVRDKEIFDQILCHAQCRDRRIGKAGGGCEPRLRPGLQPIMSIMFFQHRQPVQYCDIGSQFIPQMDEIGCFFSQVSHPVAQMIGVGLAPDEDVSMAALVAADVKA